MKAKDKLVGKWFPVSLYDIPAVERWLEDMASRGLFFVRSKRDRAYFRPGPPTALRCRLEIIPPLNEIEPGEERRAYYACRSWTYIAVLSGVYYLYCSDDPGAEEPHTDPVVQSCTIVQLERRLGRSTRNLALLLSLYLAVLLLPLFFSRQPVTRLLDDSQLVYTMLLLFYLLLGVKDLRDYLALRRTRLRLRRGIPLCHKLDYRRAARRYAALYALILTVAGVTLAMQLSYPYLAYHRAWQKNLPEAADGIPYVPLSVLEGGIRLEPLDGVMEDTGINFYNNAFYEWSPLLPVHYAVAQKCRAPGATWFEGGGTYQPALTTNYYELALPFLSGPFLNERIEEALSNPEEYGVQELEAPGFDRLVLAVRRDSLQLLFARRGGKVLCVYYYGLVDLTRALDRFAALLA